MQHVRVLVWVQQVREQLSSTCARGQEVRCCSGVQTAAQVSTGVEYCILPTAPVSLNTPRLEFPASWSPIHLEQNWSKHTHTHTQMRNLWWSTLIYVSGQSWTNDMSCVRTQRSSFIYQIRWRHLGINLKNADFPAFSTLSHTEQGSMVSVWPFSQNAASLLFYKPLLSLSLIVCRFVCLFRLPHSIDLRHVCHFWMCLCIQIYTYICVNL